MEDEWEIYIKSYETRQNLQFEMCFKVADKDCVKYPIMSSSKNNFKTKLWSQKKVYSMSTVKTIDVCNEKLIWFYLPDHITYCIHFCIQFNCQNKTGLL